MFESEGEGENEKESDSGSGVSNGLEGEMSEGEGGSSWED